MTLDQAELGKIYKIKSIDLCDSALKNRFISFGITKNSIIQLLHSSAKKSTLAISINQSQVALRDYEARFIEIESLT